MQSLIKSSGAINMEKNYIKVSALNNYIKLLLEDSTFLHKVYLKGEISNFKNHSSGHLYFTLKDRFGDHGLVSVVILEKMSKDEIFIDTWLMSCRVLKRGMEEFVMNCIVDTVRRNEFKTLSSEYIPTQKNKMVKDIYQVMGFDRTGEATYELAVNSYEPKKTFIKEE